MAVTTTQLQNWVFRLQQSYPQFTFAEADYCLWRSSEQTIYYAKPSGMTDMWDIFHELGHARRCHAYFSHDVSLLRLEAEAWAEAKTIAAQFDNLIEESHIQDSLDTYRQWLNERSTCPQCGATGVQTKKNTYSCFNCRCSWKVPLSRMCITRRYRTVLEPEE